MDTKNAAYSATDLSASTPPRLSAEYTPAEFDYYMKKAQQMRAESFANILDGISAALGRLLIRAKPAPRAPRREPVLAKVIRSRTA